jgi:hypothetical protein
VVLCGARARQCARLGYGVEFVSRWRGRLRVCACPQVMLLVRESGRRLGGGRACFLNLDLNLNHVDLSVQDEARGMGAEWWRAQ